MVKPKRPTLRGMDAFLTDEETTTTPVEQEASVPVGQPNVSPVHQEAAIPVQQDTDKTGSQDTSKTVLMKGTYYITPEHDMKLERIRLERRQKGVKVDKSALIREAIDLLIEE